MDEKTATKITVEAELLPGVSHAEFLAAVDLLNEEHNNGKGKVIDWQFWASCLEITPEQGAKLSLGIDPISWPGDFYSAGPIPSDIREAIKRRTVLLKGQSNAWRLSDLVAVLGEACVPFGMAQTVNAATDENSKNKLPALEIKDLSNWLQDEGLSFNLIQDKNEFEEKIEKAALTDAINGRLKGSIDVRSPDCLGGWKRLTPAELHAVTWRPGETMATISGHMVRFMLHAEDWKRLAATPGLEIERESKNEAVKKPKPRKKLIPKDRDTTESLLLIYELVEKYNITFNDELPGPKAWGKIVSGEFSSKSIQSISDAKKSITLAGGEKIDKSSFLEKYRRRFKKTAH